jgi:hypothetical protein
MQPIKEFVHSNLINQPKPTESPDRSGLFLLFPASWRFGERHKKEEAPDGQELSCNQL